MNTKVLENKFSRIGARLKVLDGSRLFSRGGLVALDVRHDRNGEFFEIASQPGAKPGVEVLDVQPADRHLLLLVRENDEKSKFLCGHDERHWFVARIRHSDHKTIVLRSWHKVLMNTENQSRAMRNVAFLD